MNEHFPRIRVYAVSGNLLIRDGLSLCFYMRHPSREVAPRVWSSLQAYMRAVGPQGLEMYADEEGYWQPLLGFLEHAVNERFLRAEHLETLLVERDAVTLLDCLASSEPRAVDKWLDRRHDQAAAGSDDQAQVVPNTRSPASPNPGRM